MIITLTPGQQKLLETYRQKWRSLNLSTQPIDKDKAAETIHALYRLKNLKQPEIIFFGGPRSAMRYLLSSRGKTIKQQLKNHFRSHQRRELLTTLCQMLQNLLWEQAVQGMRDTIWQELWLQVATQILPQEQLIEKIVENKFHDSQIDPEKQAIYINSIKQEDVSNYYLLCPSVDILGDCVWIQIHTALESNLNSFLWEQVISQLVYEMRDELEEMLWQAVENQTHTKPSTAFKQQQRSNFAAGVVRDVTKKIDCSQPPLFLSMRPEVWQHDGAVIDFCISVLDCEYDRSIWSVFKDLKQNCGFIFPYEDICLVCDHPIKFSLDQEDRLHAEGSAAIEFTDGYKIYANHGTIIPEKYGKILPINWQLEKLEKEPNQQIRDNILLVYATHKQANQKISQLTPEQTAQIPQYIEKWKKLALDHTHINRHQATQLINLVYQREHKPEPKIIFCETPRIAWKTEVFQKHKSWHSWAGIVTTLEAQLQKQLDPDLLVQIRRQCQSQEFLLSEECSLSLLSQLDEEFGRNSFSWRRWAGDDRLLMIHNHPELWAKEGIYLDFCFDVLGCGYDQSTWDICQGIIQHCGWIYPYKDVCLVCDRISGDK